MRALVTACVFAVSAAQAAEVPSHSFFSGNDVYDWCQHDRHAARSYVAGLFDEAAHAAAIARTAAHSPW